MILSRISSSRGGMRMSGLRIRLRNISKRRISSMVACMIGPPGRCMGPYRRGPTKRHPRNCHTPFAGDSRCDDFRRGGICATAALPFMVRKPVMRWISSLTAMRALGACQSFQHRGQVSFSERLGQPRQIRRNTFNLGISRYDKYGRGRGLFSHPLRKLGSRDPRH